MDVEKARFKTKQQQKNIDLLCVCTYIYTHIYMYIRIQKFQCGQILESVTAANRKLSQESSDSGKDVQILVGDLYMSFCFGATDEKVNVIPKCINSDITGSQNNPFVILQSLVENWLIQKITARH